MIKLNNKNITYVALADSNNSIKAPKEIWYADSANSVKLVYRRKDALIEGEDYEKYHWILTDTGNPYIQVDDTCNTDGNAYIETTYKSKYTNPGSDILIGFSINETNNIGLRIFNSAYNGGSTYVDYHKVENGVLSSSRTVLSQSNINAERYIKATFNNLIIDNTEYPTINWGSGFDNLNLSKTLLYTNQHSDNDVRYKRTKLRVNFKEHDLIPCKLLKPVPKWLDANGIRRQVGECGMIDLVSGKFYGNVNSVGTFTVENYYERKEWLVGDGSAYIDTLHLANEGLGWETHVSNLSFKKYFVWNRVVKAESPAIALYHSVITNGTVRIENNYTNSIVLQNQTDYDYIVAINSNGAVINEVQYIGQLASENISNKSIKLFYCDINEESKINTVISNGGNSQDVKCSYFRFLDSNGNYIQNLIPCTLTMDLPASMDANNIARTKGTSGMWDLVGDKFYGNVANGGTFKAVNLAEGVDYEVHEWLSTELTYGTMMQLPIDSLSFTFERIIQSIDNGNTYYFKIGQEHYYTNGNGILRVWNSGTLTYTLNEDVTFGEPITIESSSAYLTFNSVSVPQPSSPIEYIEFGASSLADNINIKTSSITVDGIERYIPVKLLKSIPSKYDANGIARQAGECGMYDTVNDKFYGNVANSGTFSVSDDS